MDLYEYQARDLFEKYEVPVLAGIVAHTPEEVRAAAEKIGGVVVVKAQVKTGGRGKAGGVKVAKTPDEAYEAAKAILGLDIKGHVVKRVMVAQGARIDKEYYFSVLLDRANRAYLSLASVEGGMEIEELAVERPDALAKIEVDPLTGIDAAKALEIAKAGGFDDELAPKVADVFVKLYDVYKGEGATLVEVNPLIQDAAGNIEDYVTVELPTLAAQTLDLQPIVTQRCVAGKSYLAVSVKNADDVAADVEITTAYGSKTLTGVKAGATVTSTFNSRLVVAPDGEIEVTGTAGDLAYSGTVQYSAHSCG